MMKNSSTALRLAAAFFSLFLFILLAGIFGGKDVYADGHQHKTFTWTGDENNHWQVCVGEGECPENGGLLYYGPHVFNGGHICVTCGYDTELGYPAYTCVTEILWGMSEPTAGGYFGVPIGDSTQVRLDMFSWTPTIPGGMNGTFDYGTVYTLTIDFEVQPTWWFAPGVTPVCKINGNPAEFIYVNASHAQVRYTFPATAPKPEPVTQTFTIPVVLAIVGEVEGTPSPGDNVFHFNIWSDSGIPFTIVNNAVQTHGYGFQNGALTITVPSWEEALVFRSAPLHIQQFDGNPNWKFDMRVFDMFFSADNNEFVTLPQGVTDPELYVNYIEPRNVYTPVPVPTEPVPTMPAPTEPAPTIPAPTIPAPTQPVPTPPPSSAPTEDAPEQITVKTTETEVSIVLPVKVKVEKFGTDPVPAALFHFGLDGMRSDQKYTFTNDTVTTPGEGTFNGTISFTVPTGSELDKLLETGFDVRELSAVVDGWSFPGEVYHISLEKDGDTITPKLEKFRNKYQIPIEEKGLLFVNRFSRSSGAEVEAPSTMLGTEDLIKEAMSLENGLYRSTLRLTRAAWSLKISWEARKSGKNIGGVNATFWYTPLHGEQKTVSVGDILRVTPEGIWIKANELAGVYQQLTGEALSFAGDIPAGEWLSFIRSDQSIFKTEYLDELFRRIVRDVGPAIDSLYTTKVPTGYHTDADDESCLAFQNDLFGATYVNYETWHSLASAASADPELKALATDIKDNFTEFLVQDLPAAGYFFLFYGGATHFLLDNYDLTVLKTSESSYVLGDQANATYGKEILKEDSVIIAEAADVFPVSAPETSQSGYPFLKKLLLDLLKGKEIFQILDQEDNAEQDYVYDFDSYRFVLPEFYRGKVEVETKGEELALLYKGYYIVGINVYGPDDEFQSGDPMTGFSGVGTASNKNYVAVAFDSVLPRAIATNGDPSFFTDQYAGISPADLSDVIYLQTGKVYDLSTVGEMDHMESYGISFYCVDLVEDNITLK